MQDFVRNNRDKIVDPFSGRPEGVEETMHSFDMHMQKNSMKNLLHKDSNRMPQKARFQS